jgi:hypothetical protein
MTPQIGNRKPRGLIREAIGRAFDLFTNPRGDRTLQKLGGQPDIIEAFQTTAGALTVASLDGKDRTIERKTTVKLLRQYADYSTVVRTAINLYRDAVGRAEPIVAPFNPKRPMNKQVEAKLKALFERPNEMRETYAQLREKAIEDYLVVGLFPWEFQITRGAEPYRIYTLDAGEIGIVKDWDGNPRMPRYVEIGPDGKVKRVFPDQMAMVMVNGQKSYSAIGVSHVEVLDTAVRALLASADFLLKLVSEPAPRGALNLGEGVNQQMVDAVRRKMEDTRHPFIIMGGTSGLEFTPFFANEEQMKVLDTQLAFKREVAAIFQLPLALFAENVEMSRANTESLLSNKQEGMGALLYRIAEAENMNLAQKFGNVEDHNCIITYAAFNYKDMDRQATITQQQIGDQPYISQNEARQDAGKERRENPSADRIWYNGFVYNGYPVCDEMLDQFLLDFRSGKIPPPTEPPAAPGQEPPAGSEPPNKPKPGKQPDKSKPQNTLTGKPKKTGPASKAAEGDDAEASHLWSAYAPDEAAELINPEQTD